MLSWNPRSSFVFSVCILEFLPKSKNPHHIGFPIYFMCVCIKYMCVCLCGQKRENALGMFIWLLHIGYIHIGFVSKCPIVTIIESMRGPVLFKPVSGSWKNRVSKDMHVRFRHCGLKILLWVSSLHDCTQSIQRNFHPFHNTRPTILQLKPTRKSPKISLSFYTLCFGNLLLHPLHW